jgi:hypothetical protein
VYVSVWIWEKVEYHIILYHMLSRAHTHTQAFTPSKAQPVQRTTLSVRVVRVGLPQQVQSPHKLRMSVG